MPTFIRLTEYRDSDSKEAGFFDPNNRHSANQDEFLKIPGNPFAYWLSNNAFKILERFTKISDHARAAKGLVTANNDAFVREWFEINHNKIGFNFKNRENAKSSGKKWFPYAKGGVFRKWYGNYESLVNWENDGYVLQNTLTSDGTRIRATNFNLDRIFKRGLSWTVISTGNQSFRFVNDGFLYDAAAGVCQTFADSSNTLLSFLNSKISSYYLNAINPTLNLHPGYLESLPFDPSTIPLHTQEITKESIQISREEWDSRETSWDFKINELIRLKTNDSKMQSAYDAYCTYCHHRFRTMYRLG